ncbi:MAG TPA: hypothetical protein VLN48_12345, partial [Bryobacteraceae bacterium]|nr:hypothetical protein [Bryobacteraceae bacterium]
EGTDDAASEEIFKLHQLGVLNQQTVLIHAVGFREEGWRLIRKTGARTVWCPSSNLFMLGRTISREVLASGVPIALGTDSPLTAEGDLLDELRVALALGHGYSGCRTARYLGLPQRSEDWIAAPAFGEPPELVVIGDRIRLIGLRLARRLPLHICHELFPLQIETRPLVLVRWNVPRLIEDAATYLGDAIRLAGRSVAA